MFAFKPKCYTRFKGRCSGICIKTERCIHNRNLTFPKHRFYQLNDPLFHHWPIAHSEPFLIHTYHLFQINAYEIEIVFEHKNNHQKRQILLINTEYKKKYEVNYLFSARF